MTLSSGATAAKAPLGGERRHVTALFCDLVDSVPMTLRLDPEDLMQVMDVFADACDGVITRHGGYVAQFMGDGILAYFGYPNANEDAASNAVAAALVLRDSIGDLTLPAGVSLQTRIGLASGLVVIGDYVGPAERRAGSIVGEPPNLAARLQALAKPDGVIVSDETRLLTRGLFRYRDLGPSQLKGFPKPVPAFELLDAKAGVSRFQALGRGLRSPLVGRAEILETIERAWQGARENRGGAYLLSGEAGIGKSRLADEAGRMVGGAPVTRWVWNCSQRRRDSALAPVVQFLNAAGAIEAPEDRARRLERFETLLAGFGPPDFRSRALITGLAGFGDPSGAQIAALAPPVRRSLTLEALVGLVEGASASGPVLLVVEDLHWCDATTLALLGRLVALASSRPWLILLTARPEFRPDWPVDGSPQRIEAGRLGRADAERICLAVDHASRLSASAVARIVERCDGVPLFIEEVTRSAVEAAALGEVDMPVPPTVHDSLIARLDRLGGARRIANIGAVVGRRFGFDLLARVADVPEDDLRGGLHSLVLSGLVEIVGPPADGRYVFKHALIRDAAYDSLLKRERQSLHRRIAAILRDEVEVIRATQPELLAYHLTESGDADAAIPFWAAAGARAAAQAAHVEAVGHYETALRLLRARPADLARFHAELRLILPLMSNVSAVRGFAAPELARLLSDARAISETLGDFDGRFDLQRNLYLFSRSAGDMRTAEAMARQCAVSAERSGLPSHRIEADHSLATAVYGRGELSAGLELFDRSIRGYWENRGEGLDYAVPIEPFVMGQIGRAWILVAMGKRDEALGAIASSLEHGRALGAPFHLAGAKAFGSAVHMFIGDYTSARALATNAMELAEEHGFQTIATIASLSFAFASNQLSNGPRDVAAVEAMLRNYEKLGVFHKYCLYLRELGRLQALEGEWAAARRTLDAGIDAAHRYGDGYFLSVLHRERAEVRIRFEKHDRAAIDADIETAINLAQAQGASGFERQALALRQRVESGAA